MAEVMNGRELVTPWMSDNRDERRFKRLLLWLLLLYLILGVIVPFLSVPKKELPPKVTEPPPLVSVELEKQEIPKPKRVVTPTEPKPEPTPKPKPKEKPKPVQKPAEKPVQKPVEVAPAPSAKPAPKAEPAEVAALRSFADDLAEMRDQVDQSTLQQTGSSAGKSNKVDRALLTSGKVSKTSGGINTSNLAHKSTGAAGSPGRTTTRVSSNLGTGGGKPGGSRKAGSAGRSEESIRKVMDRSKGSMYAVYNRALRSNPNLRGTLTVRMVIEPSGKVTSVKLISSELDDTMLEQKLLARIKMIFFGAEDVARTTLNYSFDFLPYQ